MAPIDSRWMVIDLLRIEHAEDGCSSDGRAADGRGMEERAADGRACASPADRSRQMDGGWLRGATQRLMLIMMDWPRMEFVMDGRASKGPKAGIRPALT